MTRPPHRSPAPGRFLVVAVAGMVACSALPSLAQAPVDGEVRQIVSFTLQPGAAGEVRGIYRDELLELYRADPAMLSLRVFRESESPTPVDLVVVRAFEGMAGMDASNEALGELAAEAGRSVGSIYGRISDLATGHTDEFIRMIPRLGHGDPSSMPITAFVRYRVQPGMLPRFRQTVQETLLPREERADWPSATGVYVLGGGWDVIRIVGFESLADYEEWLQLATFSPIDQPMDDIIDVRSDQILVSIPEFVVR